METHTVGKADNTLSQNVAVLILLIERQLYYLDF